MEREQAEKRAAAVRKAVKKHDAAIDKATIRLPAGTIERVKKCGYASLNAFAVNAILERLEKEEGRRGISN